MQTTLLRVLQIVFVIGSLVLVIPAVIYITEDVNDKRVTESCETREGGTGTLLEECERVHPSPDAVIGLTYAVFSLTCMTGAVALRPSGPLGGQQPQRQPIPGAGPYPPHGGPPPSTPPGQPQQPYYGGQQT